MWRWPRCWPSVAAYLLLDGVEGDRFLPTQAEEVRGYRRRLVSSCAPEAPGTVEPSEWGPALRPLWASDQLDAAAFIDPDVAPIVDQGCAIVLPLLEAAARRSWSGPV